VVKIGLALGGTRVNADGSPNPTGDYLQPPLSYNTCVDRDSDGLIKTSRGLGDIRPWADVTDGVGGATALVEDADDECILIYQRLPDADSARHVSVDADNNVWVGGYPFAQRSFHKLDTNTGAILSTFNARRFGCGGYGGLIDGNGILWSASLSQNRLLRYDPATDTGSCVFVLSSYGLGIDTNGFIWNAQWTRNSIVKVSPGGLVQIGFPKPSGGLSSRGVAVTPLDNHVWVANSTSDTVSRLDNMGNFLKAIPVGDLPTGVAVDANGKVWVTNLQSDNAMRIDPAGGADNLGAVDLTVGLGIGAGPYNYSDMTGIVATGSTSPQGTWTVVHNGGTTGIAWDNIAWNSEPEGSEPTGTSIDVKARAAETEAGLTSESFISVSNGGALSLVGQFIEIQATLKPNLSNISPVLSDLSVTSAAAPLACDVDGNGIIDRNDIGLIFAGRGATVAPGDPRDLDGDGLITVNDARGCVLLCTNPRCAP
jgi:YVTN family beta-propeller protein